LNQFDGQDGFFFVGKVKMRHNPDMGWRSTNVPTPSEMPARCRRLGNGGRNWSGCSNRMTF
jgi:hypothetical protein